MKLSDYLTKSGIGPSEFAEKIGVPASTITRIVKLRRIPRPPTMAKIAAETNGEVGLVDWYEPESAPEQARVA